MEGPDRFPNDVVELIGYLSEAEPGQSMRAVPGEGTEVPVWILGSSLYGAQLAAHLGLPYAFASHFAPAALEEAIHVYRQGFQPSRHLERPYFMMALNVFAAETDEEGRVLMSSMQQSMANLRTGRPTPLPRAVPDIAERLGPQVMAMVDQILSCSVAGSPATVREGLSDFIARYQPDELIINGQIHDHAARLESFRIASEVLTDLGASHQNAFAG